jgi:hypothetical protein
MRPGFGDVDRKIHADASEISADTAAGLGLSSYTRLRALVIHSKLQHI